MGAILLTLLFLFISKSLGLPDGAPTSACGTLFPSGHGSQFTPGTGSITLTPSGTLYTPGSEVPIVINDGGTAFKGFLVVAEDMNGNQVGTWNASATTVSPVTAGAIAKLNCNLNTGITHVSPTSKNSVTLLWIAPNTNVGPIRFKATVVRLQSTFFAIDGANTLSFGAPDAPTNLLPTAGTNTSITVSWAAATGGVAATSFELERADFPGNTFVNVYSGPLTTFTDTTVTGGMTYTYRVRAVAAVPGSYSVNLVVGAPIDGAVPPDAPAVPTLVGVPLATSISISWNAPANLNGAQVYGYNIRFGPTAGTLGAPITVLATTTSYTFTGLTPETSYNFEITALSLSGNSIPSAQLTADTARAGCLNNCNNFGVCVNSQCQCDDFHLGEDCSIDTQNAVPPPCTSGMCVRWAIVNDSILIRLNAPTTGWLGILFGAPDGMSGGDSWQFAVTFNSATNVSTVTWKDGNAPVQDTPNMDTIQNVDTARGYLDGPNVYVEWSRLLNTGDAEDKIIPVNNSIYTSLAFCPSRDFSSQHSVRTKMGLINYATGAQTQPKEVRSELAFPLIGLGVAVWCGLLFVYCITDPKNGLAKCCLRRKLGNVPDGAGRSIVDMMTMDVRFQLPDMYWAEIGLLALYFFGCLGYLIQGKRNRDDQGLDWNVVFGGLAAIHFAVAYIIPTRNSLLVYIFGIPFERAIKFHRWAGRATLPFVLTHLITMLNRFGNDKAFNFEKQYTPNGRGMGFGMIAFIFYGTLLCMAWEPIRRHAFELFYTTHFLFLGVFILGCIHSDFFLYWTIGPMCLYVIDRLVRFVRSRRSAKVNAIVPLGEVTNLQLSLDDFHFGAGDYCFIRIPEISWTQWHPFSISSSPPLEAKGETNFTFHILNMGPGTFTGALHAFAKKNSQIEVDVDGPHGRLEVDAFNSYPHVVLVCGGVGATPIMSIFGHLLDLHKAGRAKHLKSVDLIWSVKSASAVQTWFPGILGEAKGNEVFRTHLYASKSEKKDAETGEGGFEVRSGRPDFKGIFGELAKEDPDSVCVLVCGPAPMVISVQNMAMEHKFHFHKETFAL